MPELRFFMRTPPLCVQYTTVLGKLQRIIIRATEISGFGNPDLPNAKPSPLWGEGAEQSEADEGDVPIS